MCIRDSCNSVFDYDVTKLSVYTRDIGLAGIEVYDLLRDEYDIPVSYTHLDVYKRQAREEKRKCSSRWRKDKSSSIWLRVWARYIRTPTSARLEYTSPMTMRGELSLYENRSGMSGMDFTIRMNASLGWEQVQAEILSR